MTHAANVSDLTKCFHIRATRLLVAAPRGRLSVERIEFSHAHRPRTRTRTEPEPEAL